MDITEVEHMIKKLKQQQKEEEKKQQLERMVSHRVSKSTLT